MAAEGAHGRPGGHVRRIRAREGRLSDAHRSRIRTASLVLLGALSFSSASPAQAVPRDSTATRSPADSAADSTKVKKDTIEARFAQAELPVPLEVGESYHWDRAALFNTGGLTLIDVLAHVPGLTVFRSGWVPSPQFASYLGNPARIRIFWDGAEVMAIGDSASYPLDLASVPIWSVQEMSLERGADEVRIYIRSWDVTRTTTQSRVDIVTGDLGTNVLRGYFGSRFQNGMGLQFGGQVYGTSSSDVTVGGGTGTDVLARVGWAKGGWSLDAFWQRASGPRDRQAGSTNPNFNQDTGLFIAGQNGYRSNAYVRAGVGQPDSGRWWAQLMFDEQTVSQQLTVDSASPPRVTQSASQIIAAAGLNAGPLLLSASGRRRRLPLGTTDEVTARASLALRVASVSAFADRVDGGGGITDLSVKFTPTSFLVAEGAVGYRSAPTAQGGDGVSGRLEVGARFGRVWVSVGEMRRDATVVPGLVAYDARYVSAAAATATGPFFSMRGKVIQDLGVNVWVIRWTAPGFYRPQLQSRGELFLDTDWRKRFPSGHFGLHGALGFQYRSDVLFPTTGAAESLTGSAPFALFSSGAYMNLEVRILDATIYFTGNWAVDPRPYELIPRYTQQAQLYTYGLRWNFWN